MIAKVIYDLSLDREFDYRIPPELEGRLRIGSAVTVPCGHSMREGWVFDLAERSAYTKGELKAVAALSTRRAAIPEKLVELGRWMAEYYCCTQEQAIRALLPAAVRSGRVGALTRRVYGIADADAARRHLEACGKKAPAQAALLRFLLEAETPQPREALDGAGVGGESALRALLAAGILRADDETVRRDLFADRSVVPSAPLEPTPDQRRALDLVEAICAGRASSQVLLLHGATNSGKTEVYLQAIASVLKRGKSAIVLVPEISLTPQTVRRFRARFGDALSVLHSRLSDGERFDEWNRIDRGEVGIAIGARSALFAPFRNLGLIVLDEEHESSYKQSSAPRYHARDVAVMRGSMEGAAVILGSATPSAESFRNADLGKFLLARMKEQVGNRPAPLISIVDIRASQSGIGRAAASPAGKESLREQGGGSLFSPELVEAVRSRVERGEQSILFLNRRGYAHTLACPCGYEFQCPECRINYVYSKRNATLSCHWCGGVVPVPPVCPACGGTDFVNFRAGTEKLEAAALAAFHPARIARMDSDTMRSGEDYEEVLERFRRGRIDVLVGTQMIAKGLHFPNVTLVGVVNPDLGLAIPDFRAPERTFQLLAQVAGRAGRGDRPGEVIIQTAKPENEVIRFAAALDFEGFRRFDFEVREMLKYPPFGRLIALHFRGADEEAVLNWAEFVVGELKPYLHDGVILSGPVPSPIPVVKERFRYMAVLRGDGLKLIRRALRVLALHRTPPKGVEFFVDVDAQSLL